MSLSSIQSFYYESLDSTMDEAKRLIKSGQITDTAFVVANYQTSGRGTRGRTWSSPEGSGIYLSVVHLPKSGEHFKLTTLYTLASGIACAQAIKEVCGISTNLKPINDLYANEKKLGGILVESTLHKEEISALITGIGINTHKAFHQIDNLNVNPISLQELLSQEDFKKFSKKKLIEQIVNKVCFWYEFVFCGEYANVQETWNRHSII